MTSLITRGNEFCRLIMHLIGFKFVAFQFHCSLNISSVLYDEKEPSLPSLNVYLSCTLLCTQGTASGVDHWASPAPYFMKLLSVVTRACRRSAFSSKWCDPSAWYCFLFLCLSVYLFPSLLCCCYGLDRFLLACLQEYKVFLLGFKMRLKMLHMIGTGFCFLPHCILPSSRLPAPCHLDSFGFVLPGLPWSLVTRGEWRWSPVSVISTFPFF